MPTEVRLAFRSGFTGIKNINMPSVVQLYVAADTAALLPHGQCQAFHVINAILYQLLLLVPQKPAKLFCAVTIDPKISSHGFLIFHPYLRNKEGFL